MKQIILIAFSIILLSCNGTSKPDSFESCDEIEYYHLDEIKEKKFFSSETKNDALRNILFQEESINLKDPKIQEALKEFYNKKIIDEKLRAHISSLFKDQKMETQNASFSASIAICAPVYRDILIFKKDNKVSGIAKVCFDCSQNLLWTKYGETLNSPLDYYKLGEYLKK